MKGKDCLFCEIFAEKSRVVLESREFFMIFDGFPVNKGHALIIPKRHQPDIFSLDIEEWKDLLLAITMARVYLDELFHPDGYNIGINCGEAAGQTISHLHIHLIPRYKGDVENPRGGIRNFKKPLKEY